MEFRKKLVRITSAGVALGGIAGCMHSESSGLTSMRDSEETERTEVHETLSRTDSILKYFGALYEVDNFTNPTFLEEVRNQQVDLVPLALACLDRRGVRINFGDPGVSEDEALKRNRGRAALLFQALRDSARPAVPDLLGLLEDGQPWEGREYVALALASIGPTGEAAIPTALEDLESESLPIRQHALKILGGVGGKSSKAVDALKRHAGSGEHVEVIDAIWGLRTIYLAEDSDPQIGIEARDFLIGVATRQIEGGYGANSLAKYALGLESNSPSEIVRGWVERGQLEMFSPEMIRERERKRPGVG